MLTICNCNVKAFILEWSFGRCVCVVRSRPQQWWRRHYVEEFYPTVQLGDLALQEMLSQHGLKAGLSVLHPPPLLPRHISLQSPV